MVDRICRGVPTLCNEVIGGLLNNMINEIKGNNIILREQKIEDAKFFTYWYNLLSFLIPKCNKEDMGRRPLALC